ncbi:MAG: undecaprenyldiphospho-muramoylpentapeptide beta-N-acetylglucosaminyltransferase [Halothiobacillaceae bacterium]
MSRPVMIMAGGTGGHILPALAVARLLRARGVPVLWLGSRGGMEARMVPEAGFELVEVEIGGVRGKGWGTRLSVPWRLFKAVLQAVMIMRAHRPRLVLGFGGFVAGPGGLAARALGIPLVIHEQNAIAGLTNRVLARLARCVLAGYPGTFAQGAEVIGNPVRPEIAALPPPDERMGGRHGPLRLLVVGGSLGARALNETVPQALALLAPSERPEVWHQAGGKMFDATRAAYGKAGVTARVEPFIADMAAAYGWADLVLCRAGALTVAELAAAGVGSLLVPFPHAVDDHQTHNAAVLAEAGAAEIMQQHTLTAGRLAERLRALGKDRARLVEMARRARAQARPDAAERMLDLCAPWLEDHEA